MDGFVGLSPLEMLHGILGASQIARLVQRTLAKLGVGKAGEALLKRRVRTRSFLSHYKLGGGFTYFRNFSDGLSFTN